MKIDYSRPEYYYNRELSWVAFDHRVLGEARDKSLPLFERLKFLSITASNLDEFFMVRVASLKDMVNAGYKKKDIAGMTAQEQLEAVNKATHELVNMQYSTYNRSLIPLLGQNGLQVIEKHEELEEEEAADLLKEIEKQLKQRQWGQVIRLEVEDGINERLLSFIQKELCVEEQDIYEIPGPLDLTFLMKMYGMSGFDHLKTPPYIPQPVDGLASDCNLFDEIRQRDILLHHPYETFAPVVDFIKQASRDPEVLAIKQTLYRVSGNSPIIAALSQAAENGKQVTVLVELKARFDEENNIVWAKKLEKAGCHVIYGLVGLKTHCKITLVVRREEEGIRRYVHLGTGNYNDSTAKLYTDCGILTCNEAIGEDATAVFNMLSGYSEPLSWNHLALAPLWLKDKFLYLINREKDNAKQNRPAHIIAKMNSLCDPDVIRALYEAAAAGVKIDLIVRGICCLRTGVEGTNDNISVRSIVGNFLEHARIFYFENGGNPELYMGSADWMPRNLERRVEILFPVLNPELKEKVWHILDVQMRDTVKAQLLKPDGTYEKVDKRGKVLCNAQEEFCKEYMAAAHKHKNEQQARVFKPETHIEAE